MPELPEVEMARKYLEGAALHQTIEMAEVRAERILFKVSARILEEALAGQQFFSALRHGKRLFLEVHDALWLALHLGLTGSLIYLESEAALPRHTRLLIAFENGRALALDDPRIFGEVSLTKSPQAFLEERKIGPDAQQIDRDGFLRIMSGRKGLIKPALLNQRLVAGLGNLYADEALFQAGICPEARGLDEVQLDALFSSIQEVLWTALSTNADLEKLPDSYLLAHRHPGGRCPRDGSLLLREKIGGRTSYYCPEHQKKSC
jgi:formamidopyrimidine-DNA glycosylase